jgi:hypothetical protein
MPMIPPTWEKRQRQEDHEFDTSLGKVSKTLSQKQIKQVHGPGFNSYYHQKKQNLGTTPQGSYFGTGRASG